MLFITLLWSILISVSAVIGWGISLTISACCLGGWAEPSMWIMVICGVLTLFFLTLGSNLDKIEWSLVQVLSLIGQEG